MPSVFELLDQHRGELPPEEQAPLQTPGQTGAGLRSAFTGMYGNVQNFAGGVGEALGADEFARERYARGAQLLQEAEEQGPRVKSYTDVKNLRDAFDYGTGLLGQGAAYALPAIGAGMLAKTPVGRNLAGAAALAPMEVGDVIGRQQASPEALREDAGTRLGKAALAGGASALANTVLPAAALGHLVEPAAKAGLRRSAGQILGEAAANVPLGGALGVAGEAAKQTALPEPYDTHALAEAGVGGAVGGGLMGGLGAAGELAHNAAATHNNVLSGVGKTAKAAAEKAKEWAGAGNDALKEKTGIDLSKPVDTVRSAMDPVTRFKDDFLEKVAAGEDTTGLMAKAKNLGDAAVETIRERLPEFDEERIAEVKKLGDDLLKMTGLPPEVQESVKKNMANLGDKASQMAIAGYAKLVKGAQWGARTADELHEAFKQGRAAAKAELNTKKSEDFSGVRKAIWDNVGPLLESIHPDTFRPGGLTKEDTRMRMADGLRLAIDVIRDGGKEAITSDRAALLIDKFGDKAVDVLESTYMALHPLGSVKPEERQRFFEALDELRMKQKGHSEQLGVLLSELKPELEKEVKMPQLGKLMEGMRAFVRDAHEGKDSGAEARYFTNKLRDELATYFKNPDKIFDIFEKEYESRQKANVLDKERIKTDEDGNELTREGHGLSVDKEDPLNVGSLIRDKDGNLVKRPAKDVNRHADNIEYGPHKDGKDAGNFYMSPEIEHENMLAQGKDPSFGAVAQAIKRYQKQNPDRTVEFVSAKALGEDHPRVREHINRSMEEYARYGLEPEEAHAAARKDVLTDDHGLVVAQGKRVPGTIDKNNIKQAVPQKPSHVEQSRRDGSLFKIDGNNYDAIQLTRMMKRQFRDGDEVVDGGHYTSKMFLTGLAALEDHILAPLQATLRELQDGVQKAKLQARIDKIKSEFENLPGSLKVDHNTTLESLRKRDLRTESDKAYDEDTQRLTALRGTYKRLLEKYKKASDEERARLKERLEYLQSKAEEIKSSREFKRDLELGGGDDNYVAPLYDKTTGFLTEEGQRVIFSGGAHGGIDMTKIRHKGDVNDGLGFDGKGAGPERDAYGRMDGTTGYDISGRKVTERYLKDRGSTEESLFPQRERRIEKLRQTYGAIFSKENPTKPQRVRAEAMRKEANTLQRLERDESGAGTGQRKADPFGNVHMALRGKDEGEPVYTNMDGTSRDVRDSGSGDLRLNSVEINELRGKFAKFVNNPPSAGAKAVGERGLRILDNIDVLPKSAHGRLNELLVKGASLKDAMAVANDLTNKYARQFKDAAPEVAAKGPKGEGGYKKYSRESTRIHEELERPGFAATHDSPIKHDGRFDWRKHKLKGEGAMVYGAGTYLSTADGVHRSYKNKFSAQVGGGKEILMDGKSIKTPWVKNNDAYKKASIAEKAVISVLNEDSELRGDRLRGSAIAHVIDNAKYDLQRQVDYIIDRTTRMFDVLDRDEVEQAYGRGYVEAAFKTQETLERLMGQARDERTGELLEPLQKIDYDGLIEYGKENKHPELVKYAEAAKNVGEVIAQLEDMDMSRFKVNQEKSPTYHVSVDIKPEQLMDWDKPLSAQGDTVGKMADFIDKEEQRRYEVLLERYKQELATYPERLKAFLAENTPKLPEVEKAIAKAIRDTTQYTLDGDEVAVVGGRVLVNGKPLDVRSAAEVVLALNGGEEGRHTGYEVGDVDIDYPPYKPVKPQKPRSALEYTGEEAYRYISSELGSTAKASDYLQSLGILGHKYAAAGGKNEAHPNYVIYDDSKITTNYVHMDKTAASSSGPLTKAQEADVRKYIDDVLGKAISVEFKNLAHAGEFERMVANGVIDDVVRISTHALNPMSTAYHESLHAFFAKLMDQGNGQVAKVLKDVAMSDHVQKQLKDFFKGNTDVLAQLKDPEESAAYMYQLWANNQLQIGPATKNIFQKIADMVRKVLGIWSKDERAERIMQYFHDGEFKANMSKPNAVAEALLKKGTNKAVEKVGAMTKPLVEAVEALTVAGHQRLRDTGIPALRELADKMKAFGHDETDDPGFIPAARIERTRILNEMSERLRGYKQEDIDEAVAAAQERRVAKTAMSRMVLRELQATSLPGGGKGLFPAMLRYMEKAGVDTKGIKEDPNYFPRKYDAAAISRDRDGFIAVLTKHNIDLRTATAIVQRLTANDGLDPLYEVNRPGMTNLKPKKLAMIPDKELAPYMSKNLYEIMNSYVTQATRRAEWARRFTDAEDAIEDIKLAAAKQGATTKQLEMAEKFVQAVDGTLGDDLNPTARRLMGDVMVYQNIRLLPLAIFSSIIDPLGIVMRGGEVRDAWDAFKRGMKEMPHAWGKAYKADWQTKLAETMGVIDSAAIAQDTTSMYMQGMVGDTARKFNEHFFRYNFMDGFNRSMRVSASQAALKFIERHADLNGGNRHSERWLAELGLKKGVKVDINDPKIRAAVNMWVDGAVLRPTAVDKPIWMNDPHYMLFAHLKQFVYAFQENIIKRAIHEAKQGNYRPAMALTSYVPVMIASDMVKGMILGGGSTPAWQEDWGVEDYVANGVQRAGLLGKGQFLVDAFKDLRRGEQLPASLGGPTVEQSLEALKTVAGHEQPGTFVKHALPAHALYMGFVDKSAAHADPTFAE